MNRCFSSMPAVVSAALLQLCASKSDGCETGSGSITNLPPNPGFGYQVFGINNGGQLTGFFFDAGQHPGQAFLYSSGQLSDLGTFGGTISEGHWINDAGQIVGKANLAGDAQSHAFLYQGGPLVDLGTLGGSNSTANVINDSGVIIGDSDLPGGTGTSGFIYINGVMSSIGNLGSNYSLAYGLNNSGLVVGESALPSGDVHGITYLNGTLTDIGTLGGNYSAAFAVNDNGLFVGESYVASSDTHAFVSSNGSLVDLGTFGGTYSSAYLVNSNGQVVGVANTSGDLETHGFVYASGNLVDMGTLGGAYSLPNAINNRGQIVGESVTVSNDTRAFIWQNGALTDLNSLLPANSGWVLTSALYINDAGRIVGVGDFGGVSEWFIFDPAGSNSPPVADAGPNQTVDCQSQVTLDGSHSSDPGNGPLTYEWSSSGNVLGTTATLTVALPMGTNVVTLKVTDTCGDSSQTNVTVIVADTTPPVGSCPPGVTVSADANCQAVVPDFTSQVTATDNCTPTKSLVISQSPVAGTSVGLGQHPVTITVTDASGNSSSCMVLFTVADTTPPSILSVPGPVMLSVGADCQAQVPNVLAGVVAFDSCTPANLLVKNQSPAPGTLIGAGSYSILIKVTDAAGNFSTTNVGLTVADTTAPTILGVPSPVTLSADANCSAVVPDLTAGVTAVDNCTPANQIVITQNPAPGTVLARGSYLITFNATDASGNSSSASVPLSIVSATAPVIQALSVSPGILSPPNHQLVPVTVSATVTGTCDGAPVTRIVSITCSDTPSPGDIQITGDLTATLAASKASSGNTRIYTLNIQSTDASGNSSTGSVTVTVPKSNGNGGNGGNGNNKSH